MPVPQLHCPICTSERSLDIPTHHDWNDVRWQFVRCCECDHRYTDQLPTNDELACMYADDYFADGGAWVCGFWRGSYESNERKLRLEARAALEMLPPTRGKLLEIGAAGGFFLDEARAAGYDVTGIELNQTMAEWGKSVLGLDIKTGSFESVALATGSFDVIVAQDVLEHVREPRAFVARVAGLLAPEGIFLVRGPLEQSCKDAFYLALRRLTGRPSGAMAHPPYHLQGFVRRSFRVLIEDAGLVLIRFEAHAARPRIDPSSLKGIVAAFIELIAYQANRLTARGDFMIAYITRAERSP